MTVTPRSTPNAASPSRASQSAARPGLAGLDGQRDAKQWWGPEQFTNPVVEGDVKVGGVMRITMRGPKGSPFDIDMPMIKRYREIVPGRKLVFENDPLGPNGERLIDGLTTVTFSRSSRWYADGNDTTAKALVPWRHGAEAAWNRAGPVASTNWAHAGNWPARQKLSAGSHAMRPGMGSGLTSLCSGVALSLTGP